MDNNRKGSDKGYQGRRDYDRRPSGQRSGRQHFTRTGKTSSESAERVFSTDYSSDQRNYSEKRPYRPRTERPYKSDRLYRTDRPYDSDRSERAERPERRERVYSSDRAERSYGSDRQYGFSEKKSYGKPSYGQDRPYKKSGFSRPSPKAHRREEESGIEAMISKRPQVSNTFSDNDSVKTPIKEVVRLNKFIANSGVCSRREADTLIQSGVVTVNGEVVTELGVKVNVLTDDIRFNGERLKGEDKVYLVMNKPKGFVTTASDPHADKTVMDLIKDCPKRVFPVGRLDKSTTGVLMFTNDGEMAEKLTHPSYNKKKIYQVTLDQPLSEEDKEKILAGIELSDGVIKADELEYIDPKDHRKLGIEIHSGKNRIVRRIFESLGYDVRSLDRVYFAGLTKKGLKKGDWRYLTEGEVNILKMGAYV